MQISDYITAPMLVLSLMVSISAKANENQPHDLSQQLAQNMGTVERAALREQLINRMRNGSPAEQSLIRDSAYDGRKRMENSEEVRIMQRDSRNEESGYGRGHESRQGGSNGMSGGGISGAGMSSSGMSGAGMSGGGMGGGGRGMSGGRGR